jgi:hypothetical protein
MKYAYFCAGMVVGYLVCQNSYAQTYVITNPQGYQTGSVQILGNTGQVVNNAGITTQTFTIYPNQVVSPSGYAIGTPSYTIPPSPPVPPTVRTIQ